MSEILPQDIQVLIVDDDPAIRDILCRIVKAEGFQVGSASTAKEALKRIAEDEPDLVITDLVMPGMSGADLIRQIQEQRPTIRIIRTSGYTPPDLADVKDTPFLRKPFRRNEVADMLHAVLKR